MGRVQSKFFAWSPRTANNTTTNVSWQSLRRLWKGKVRLNRLTDLQSFNESNFRYPSEHKRDRYESYGSRSYQRERERDIGVKKRWVYCTANEIDFSSNFASFTVEITRHKWATEATTQLTVTIRQISRQATENAIILTYQLITIPSTAGAGNTTAGHPHSSTRLPASLRTNRTAFQSL